MLAAHPDQQLLATRQRLESSIFEFIQNMRLNDRNRICDFGRFEQVVDDLDETVIEIAIRVAKFDKGLLEKRIVAAIHLCHLLQIRRRHQPDDDVSVRHSRDTQVIAGSVDSVVEQILELREIIGPFGQLMYTGHDWADVLLSRRSMELMALEVMPRVNKALGESVCR